MDHLTANQTEELRADLTAQLRKLERSMRVTDQALEPVKLDQSAVGRLSRIDALQNQGLTRNLQEREQIKLAHVREAFRRMDEGTYGRCVSCGSPIPFPRLYVFPETPTCAACGANP
jgi:DnaK suppressor protein